MDRNWGRALDGRFLFTKIPSLSILGNREITETLCRTASSRARSMGLSKQSRLECSVTQVTAKPSALMLKRPHAPGRRPNQSGNPTSRQNSRL